MRSVLAQTYGDWELILIDDGSTDGVQKQLREYDRHPQVRCFRQDNQGLPKALSNGFDLARGEFWTWTSADNIMQPRMLERLAAKLQAEPDLGMVYADYYAIDDRGALLRGDFAWRSHNRPRPDSGEIRLPRNADKLNTVQDNFIGPCFLYRGWVGRLLGDYAPQTGIEDYDYWMRLNAFFPLRHLGADELLYRYRVHDNTISGRAREHRILSKARGLMRHEKERAVSFRSKANIAADASARAWLAAGRLPRPRPKWVSIPDTPQGWANLPPNLDLLALDSRHAAVLLENFDDSLSSFPRPLRHSREYPQGHTSGNPDRESSPDTPLALLFTGDAEVCPRLLQLLRRDGCIALTDNPHTAERIRRVAACPALDSASAQAPAATLAFARNHRLFRERWSAEQLSRRPPQRLAGPISPPPPPPPTIRRRRDSEALRSLIPSAIGGAEGDRLPPAKTT